MIHMPEVTVPNALLGLGMVVFFWMMYRFNRANGNSYNVVDLLMGPNGRASMTNHILLAMAVLSCWTVIDRELKGKDDVSTILLGVLGIFVAQKTATIVTDILNRPDQPSKPKGGEQ
jgi:hypothetical protein